jgi:glucosamine-6-phosphate deaminase
VPVYRGLERLVSAGLNLSRVRWFALDEYVGLPLGHRQSYRCVLERILVRPLGLDPARVHVPDPHRTTPEDAARAYDREIAAFGGIDLQILGIGANGHIGFNEPGTPFDSRTRVSELSPRTRSDNARFFSNPSETPRLCVTQGIGTIMEARHLALIASGSAKAAAVAAAIRDDVTHECPASVLRLHPSVSVDLDVEAAALLDERRPRRAVSARVHGR